LTPAVRFRNLDWIYRESAARSLTQVNISMKSRYAVRALTELARVEQTQVGKPVRLGEIAERRDMPLQFLEQVFAALRRGGIVRSRRGASGGYALARPADDITVLDVVAALDGVPSPAECTQGRCDEVDRCGASSVWIDAQHALEKVLTATTIGDLLRREDALRESAPMYHI
jgi:Rrf2 family protein